jgi:hypothetical protein
VVDIHDNLGSNHISKRTVLLLLFGFFVRAEKYMLFKGSNNLVQIYRLFVITGNYGRQSFSKYGIFYYDASFYVSTANFFFAPL